MMFILGVAAMLYIVLEQWLWMVNQEFRDSWQEMN